MRQARAIGLLAGLGLAALVLAERRWPRRGAKPEPGRRTLNLALGAASLAVVALLERPLSSRLAGRVVARRQGLVQALPGAGQGADWLRDMAAVLLLDYATYHWHVATHRVPLLWRLHRVHHSDGAMDWTTALRFHALDMALSVPLRLAEVRLIGVSPRALEIYGAWFFAHVAFHHADLKLGFDSRLAWFLTTPGMHDIHHRADVAATDANFSSGLSIWDRVHGSFSEDRPAVAIGLPGPAGQAPRSLAGLLGYPFNRP